MLWLVTVQDLVNEKERQRVKITIRDRTRINFVLACAADKASDKAGVVISDQARMESGGHGDRSTGDQRHAMERKSIAAISLSWPALLLQCCPDP